MIFVAYITLVTGMIFADIQVKHFSNSTEEVRVLKNNSLLSLIFSLVFLTSQSSADEILFGFVGTGYYRDGENLVSKLVNDGHNVTSVNLWSMIVSDFSGYDQVWVYDLSASADVNNTQLINYTNIATWYNDLDTKNLIVDGRIVSSADSWVRGGGKPSENGLIQSYASVLESRNGGLVLGTDHATDFTRGINEINSQIGIGDFEGFYHTSPLEAIIDEESLLYDGTFGFAASDGSGRICINDNSSTSFVPTGLQENGQTLTPFAYHGNVSEAWNNAAIATSFGSITFGTVPEPGTISLMLVGMVSFFFVRRKNR